MLLSTNFIQHWFWTVPASTTNQQPSAKYAISCEKFRREKYRKLALSCTTVVYIYECEFQLTPSQSFLLIPLNNLTLMNIVSAILSTTHQLTS